MDWKKIGKKLLYPPIWLQLPMVAVSAAGLVYIFLKGLEEAPVAYIVYVLSFYTLCVVCLFCCKVLPKRYHQLKQKVMDIPLANRYVTDRIFRTKISLHRSLAVNLLYAAVNILSWYLYRSWWFACLAVYYVILSVTRWLLVRYVQHHEIGSNRRGELIRSVVCSCVMLLLNLFLSGAVLMMVYQNRGYAYHGILIYVMAMYTFYTTATAVVDLVKYRKFKSPVMSTAKMISLAAALVSMLNLETAMFAEFGAEMSRENQQLMIMLTGAGISVAVIAMAAFRIVGCTREIKKLRSGENG